MSEDKDEAVDTTSNTSNNVGNEYKFNDYSVFQDAKRDTTELIKVLDNEIQNIKNSAKTISSPDVFAGPVADSCKEALEKLDKRLNLASENFSKISSYFDEVATAYKNGDNKADKLILSKGEDGKLATETAGLVGDTNEEKIFNYLKAKGLTDAEVCGIMACIYHESRFLSGAESDRPGDESIGICQWLAERRTLLENYCREHGKDVTDLEAQLDFIFYECETTQKRAALQNLQAIAGETTDAAAKAADRWLIDYEGCGRSKQSYPYHTRVRQEKARELFQKYHK